MRVALNSGFARFTAWILTVSMSGALLPVDAFARDRNAQESCSKTPVAKVKSIPEARALTAKEMSGIYGRGQYRNAYLCGTMPWHRSFRDVNLCTGNLFKSSTDIQVAPGRGAGLVLQRTYNSNDDRQEGAFGHGWSHAYDIRMEEAADIGDANLQADGSDWEPTNTMDKAVRTDFFGGKHSYKRDADGLYTPPAYLFDWMESDYKSALAAGPGSIDSDTETSQDGSVKHFRPLSDTSKVRVCDYMKDRNGNYTEFFYDDNGNLSMVVVRVDPQTIPATPSTSPGDNDRVLKFTWQNYGTTADPHYRVTQCVFRIGPSDDTAGIRQKVSYTYYMSGAEAGAGGEPYNLKSVTLDPGGLNRTTTYAYTSVAGETGLLASVRDPLYDPSYPGSHEISYRYAVPAPGASSTGTVRVDQVTEPGGVDKDGIRRSLVWDIEWDWNWTYIEDATARAKEDAGDLGYDESSVRMHFTCDSLLRVRDVAPGIPYYFSMGSECWEYDYTSSNNVRVAYYCSRLPCGNVPPENVHRKDVYKYGRFGNVLEHTVACRGGEETTGYWDESHYFQKKWQKDAKENYTYYYYGSANDPKPGNKGNLLAIWTPLHAPVNTAQPDPDDSSPKFRYEYNRFGQRIRETNPNGVVTEYTYNVPGEIEVVNPWEHIDTYGYLVNVIQDPGASPHVNRVTWTEYDDSGRLLKRRDPIGSDSLLCSSIEYNNLGQPTTVSNPATLDASGQQKTPAETISYDYGANGRMESTSLVRGSHTITTALTYEPNCDRVASSTETRDGSASYTTSYNYTLRGNVLEKHMPSGEYYTYWYMKSGQENANWYELDNYQNFSRPAEPDSLTTCPASIMYHENSADSIGTVVCEPRRYIPRDTWGREEIYYNWAYAKWDAIYNTKYVTVNGVKSLVAFCGVMNFYEDWQSIPLEPSPDFQLGNCSTYRIAKTFNEYHWLENGVWRWKLLSENKYTYDDNDNKTDNIVRVMQTDGTYKKRHEHYDYDALNRLTQVSYTELNDTDNSVIGTPVTQHYRFDDMGNRISDQASGIQNYFYNNGNMLERYNSPTQNYFNDANGNQLSGGGRINTWDSQNRLVACQNGSTTSTFDYGSDGLRRQMTVTGPEGTAKTDYILEGSDVVQETVRNGQGALISNTSYLMNLGRIVTTFDPTTGAENPKDIRWFVYDHLGTVLAEVSEPKEYPDGSGGKFYFPTVTPAPRLDVYGNAQEADTGTGKHRFVGKSGHTTEPDMGGLIYMRARWYDPVAGRFVSEDPAKDGVNWYVYCYNNPANLVDGNGKRPGPLEDILTWAVGFIEHLAAWLNPRVQDWVDDMFQERIEEIAELAASPLGGPYKVLYEYLDYNKDALEDGAKITAVIGGYAALHAIQFELWLALTEEWAR